MLGACLYRSQGSPTFAPHTGHGTLRLLGKDGKEGVGMRVAMEFYLLLDPWCKLGVHEAEIVPKLGELGKGLSTPSRNQLTRKLQPSAP